MIVGAVEGRAKSDLLAPGFAPVDGLWDDAPLAPAIAEVANGSFRDREPPEIAGTGYVVRSLEAALWAFAKSTTFEDGALLAVNLGDDADTTGAIYGQLAGALLRRRRDPGALAGEAGRTGHAGAAGRCAVASVGRFRA